MRWLIQGKAGILAGMASFTYAFHEVISECNLIVVEMQVGL